MKLLTKEQEQAHYNATLTGGLVGGGTGLAVGYLGVLAASRRYQFFRQLTLPLKAFLITSSGTFAGIVTADHYSRNFEREQNPIDREYDARQKEREMEQRQGKTFTQRAMDFGREERYKIVGASWIASMIVAFALVNRNKYLTGQQKLVQARVYAQFLTVGVLVATAAFEISDRNNETGRYETIQVVDPNDPEHKRMIEKRRFVEESEGDTMWKDMVAAEEQRMKEKEEEEKQYRAKKSKSQPKEGGDKKKEKEKEKKKEGKKDDGEKKKKDDQSEDKSEDGNGDDDKEDDSKDTKQDDKDSSKDDKKSKDEDKSKKKDKKGDK